MRMIIVGLGIQGKKRLQVAGSDCVATVDLFQPDARYKQVTDVPLDTFDAALVCTPDEAKLEILTYLLSHGKHVLVEKPLFAPSQAGLQHLCDLVKKHKVACYTAYNHRFEPHFVRMKELIDSQKLGKLYRCRLFYGNGTARDVRNSPWRDKNGGVIPDLGSHLLNTVFFWFGHCFDSFRLDKSYCFENKSPDHAIISAEGALSLELEMTLLSWKNHFTCDLFGEKGSAHIESLCKWGPSHFIVRTRKFPSGKPNEEICTLIQPDPTWVEEYQHFKKICQKAQTNLADDLAINAIFQQLLPTPLCEVL